MRLTVTSTQYDLAQIYSCHFMMDIMMLVHVQCILLMLLA
jgi:hypothetical protein